MILYTPMPQELVWENYERMAEQQVREIVLGGVTMLVEPIGPYEGRIVRMISPNPQDYLNPRLAPGQRVSFLPRLQWYE